MELILTSEMSRTLTHIYIIIYISKCNILFLAISVEQYIFFLHFVSLLRKDLG